MLKNLKRAIAAIGVCVALAGTSPASTVAITEFIVNPPGNDERSPEWIEFFNYGSAPVNVGGWTLRDNTNNFYAFPAGFTIASGDYAVVLGGGQSPADPVPEVRRENFLNTWLSGVDDPRIAPGFAAFALNNSNTERLSLRNADGDVIWNVGWTVDAELGNPTNPNPGTDTTPISANRATFLAIDDFSVNDYGEHIAANPPKVNRNGMDLTGTLGYEDNNRTTDPHAYAVTSIINGVAGATVYGSPLRGHYTAVPEPASLSLLLGFAVGIFAMRRGR